MNQSIIVYGPHACGKTRNAVALARHFGLSKILDDQDADRIPSGISVDTLVLTNSDLNGTAHLGLIRCMPYARAAAAAGICNHATATSKD
ncbi:hypothetical protein ABE493_07720 [Stenotrophomonas terrae]|uniref:hypothetical protein n=1 Tax=Stenotrophomonas terrae TaxID=405446 RepID=UPI003208D741